MTTPNLPKQITLIQTSPSVSIVQKNSQKNQVLTPAIGVDKSFAYRQPVPSTLWHVAHDLGKVPSVTITDATGLQYLAEVRHLSPNVCEIHFAEPFAGVAYFN